MEQIKIAAESFPYATFLKKKMILLGNIWSILFFKWTHNWLTNFFVARTSCTCDTHCLQCNEFHCWERKQKSSSWFDTFALRNNDFFIVHENVFTNQLHVFYVWCCDCHCSDLLFKISFVCLALWRSLGCIFIEKNHHFPFPYEIDKNDDAIDNNITFSNVAKCKTTHLKLAFYSYLDWTGLTDISRGI